MEGRALGKGLAALIPDKLDVADSDVSSDKVFFVKTSKIQKNSLQPRSVYDEEKITELVSSIKSNGILQPILVREMAGGYEVIAGERRLRAARQLNLEEVPVVVKNVNNQEALVLALVENIQREELNPIEEALAFKRLIEEFDYSHDKVADAVGKNRSTITNLIRLLKLPEEIQKSISLGKLSMGHARALLGLSEDEQKRFYEKIISENLSVREVEAGVAASDEKLHLAKKAKRNQQNHEVIFLEEDLQQFLGTKVKILLKKGRGKIVIDFYSPDDLERIMTVIKE